MGLKSAQLTKFVMLFVVAEPRLVVRHPLQNSKRWVSLPPQRAPRCSAVPVMESPRASSPPSSPPPALDHSIRNASPASFRVRWDGCSSLTVFFPLVLSLCPLWMRLSPHTRINQFSNAIWQLGLQSVLDLHAECTTVCAPAALQLHDADEISCNDGDYEVKEAMG